MTQYNSGAAFSLGNTASGVFESTSNGELQINWAGTSTNLSLTIGGVTTVVATGAAAPSNTGTIKFPVAAGQQVTVTTGVSLTAEISSKQRLT